MSSGSYLFKKRLEGSPFDSPDVEGDKCANPVSKVCEHDGGQRELRGVGFLCDRSCV